MKVAALIPCRIGSKGIPNKNFRDFAGKPLWEWTDEAAKKSNVFDLIIRSTDGGFLMSDTGIIISEAGKTVDYWNDNARPSQLSTDEATLDALLIYYAEKHPEIDLWCLLQPTSPLRTAEDIKEAYKIIKGSKYDSLVSVTPNPGMFWVDNAAGLKGNTYPIATYHLHKRPNRQDRKDWYMENGAIYFTKKHVLSQMGCRLGGVIALYSMPQERSFEIDTPLDWDIAEYVAMKQQWGVDTEVIVSRKIAEEGFASLNYGGLPAWKLAGRLG